MAVQPTAQINSVINLGLSSGIPELYTNAETRSLYQLLVQTAENILSQLERYGNFTQKPIAQWPQLAPSVTLTRHQAGRLYCIFSETVAYGALVNLYNNAGVLTARNANSSTNKPAYGYCNVNNTLQSGAANGQFAEVILSQGIIPITGVAPADRLFLSAVNGQAQVGPDLVAGHLEQFIGIGIATNLAYIDINLGSWIQH